MLYIEIIVETAVDRRTNGELGIRVQSLDCLCQNMGCCMPEGFLTVRIIKGTYLKGAVLRQNRAHILDLAVDLHTACSLVQTHTDALDDLGSGDILLDLADGTVL